MTRLPELHRQLVAGARRQEEQETSLGWLLRSALRRRARGAEPLDAGVGARIRRLRVFLFSLGGLLATTTVALAASGVILTGSPVPSKHLSPTVGTGVPAKPGAKLLPLRASDPEGGLPWGMRIVRTTRGEVCLQVGRVLDGELGELGVDGAFHDDGKFHPLPARALPSSSHGESGYEANANTSCTLAGEAVAGYHFGLPTSAAGETADPGAIPRSGLRDVYYGLLGPQAVSITYPAGGRARTEAVLPQTGAYLIVRRISPKQQPGSGGASVGTYGDLSASSRTLLSSIAYRIGGKLCERGSTLPSGVKSHVAHPCPTTHWPSKPGSTRPAELHVPLHVHLEIASHIVTAVKVSFEAPYPVTSAKAEYIVAIPTCGKGEGYGFEALDRDVRRGETIKQVMRYPFQETCHRRKVTIEVIYRLAKGEGSTLVGKIVLTRPPGTRVTPPLRRGRRHPR